MEAAVLVTGFLPEKVGNHARKGREGKVTMCLTLREGGHIYKLPWTFVWHRVSQTPISI